MACTVEQYKKMIMRATPIGGVAIIWSLVDTAPRVARVLLPLADSSVEEQVRSAYPAIPAGSCRAIDAIARAILAFLKGRNAAFLLDSLDFRGLSTFQKSVLLAQYRVPRGYVTSYKLIARHLGEADAARAVGNALADNPFPILIPCHRTIRADGHLGGFQGGQAGQALKKELLQKEGIRFDCTMRVVGAPLYYGR